MEKISVIIPVYKVEEYLDECVLSVINQTYKNLEIILVDDGSPDKCGEICDKYSKIDDRVIVIHKSNGGLSDARNKGIEVATGKYISFIDSDDYVDLRYFEILYNKIKEYNANIVLCSYKKFSKREEVKGQCKINEENKVLKKEDALVNLYGKYRVDYVIACGKLFDIKLFEEIRFPYGKINEDSFTTYKLYNSAEKIIYNSSKLYFYRQRSNSIMNQKVNERRLDGLESLEEQINFYKKNNIRQIQIEAMKCYSFALGNYYNMFKKIKRFDICKSINKKRRLIIDEAKLMQMNREDFDFIKAPWQYINFIEIYWFFISLRKKLLK